MVPIFVLDSLYESVNRAVAQEGRVVVVGSGSAPTPWGAAFAAAQSGFVLQWRPDDLSVPRGVPCARRARPGVVTTWRTFGRRVSERASARARKVIGCRQSAAATGVETSPIHGNTPRCPLHNREEVDRKSECRAGIDEILGLNVRFGHLWLDFLLPKADESKVRANDEFF